MRRALKWLAALLAAAAVTLVLGTVVPRPLFAVSSADPPSRTILLFSNPIHTDIALPIDAGVLESFAFLPEAGVPSTHPEARWLLFGWGSRAFYIATPTWGDLRPGPLFKGLTLDKSVIHVEARGDLPDDAPYVTAYEIGEPQFQALLSFIRKSFVEANGQPVAIPDVSYGYQDAFFEAHGYFSAAVGCNTWTAGALRAAGLQTGWWNPLPQSLAVSLSLHNGEAQAGGSQP
jgi:uncharacterized protein (TIGR02117 family)